MRITNLSDQTMINETVPARDGEGALKKAVRAERAPSSEGAGRDAALLKATQASLDKTPAIDAARVAEIKSALNAGEITFDADKLASLMLRYHGGRK
ncbi:flagellar biosynthesis anti-sigma factor FlgM [Paraburkholderia hayleyella]|uniref:flagellar biosynthesis anti-sigma factor FlgM n=1 Tax=Paraburkholderia hayleyella TaxID=2152889 RepID=UPI001C659DA7|nr:flagellar biosynthesis anti-sigma factor FlgM [Paraburkholderia hayleyella]